jgi:hypothetical protein
MIQRPAKIGTKPKIIITWGKSLPNIGDKIKFKYEKQNRWQEGRLTGIRDDGRVSIDLI